MGFVDIQKIWQAMMTNPIQTGVILFIMAIVGMGTVFLKNFLSETGKRAGSGFKFSSFMYKITIGIIVGIIVLMVLIKTGSLTEILKTFNFQRSLNAKKEIGSITDTYSNNKDAEKLNVNVVTEGCHEDRRGVFHSYIEVNVTDEKLSPLNKARLSLSIIDKNRNSSEIREAYKEAYFKIMNGVTNEAGSFGIEWRCMNDCKRGADFPAELNISVFKEGYIIYKNTYPVCIW
jgi:hypothetical protein